MNNKYIISQCIPRVGGSVGVSSRSGAIIARMALSMWMYHFQNFFPRAYIGEPVGVSSKLS